jgi:hypothetical protein
VRLLRRGAVRPFAATDRCDVGLCACAVAYSQKSVTVDNVTCKLNVWDTVGQGAVVAH